ncbi:fimbrial protein [Providencia rettgeri]|uniref:fimbrial protein n=1 Tax=Providencia rettgeri TaxID=587 RepID=UPI00029C1EF7|nr:fimbrial protein [Providencia rettgeri]EKT57784.1 fimbrial protein [Providencia rettgeri Dmel1]
MHYCLTIFFILAVIQNCLASNTNGDIFMHGILVEEPCSLNINSTNQTVNLGNVIKNTLYLHPRTHNYPFSIILEECDLSLGNSVEMSFSGTADLLQPDLLAINGTAQGFAIGLETETGTPIHINKTINIYQLSPDKTTINFSVYLQAPQSIREKEEIIEGNFSATVNFTLNYP